MTLTVQQRSSVHIVWHGGGRILCQLAQFLHSWALPAQAWPLPAQAAYCPCRMNICLGWKMAGRPYSLKHISGSDLCCIFLGGIWQGHSTSLVHGSLHMPPFQPNLQAPRLAPFHMSMPPPGADVLPVQPAIPLGPELDMATDLGRWELLRSWFRPTGSWSS